MRHGNFTAKDSFNASTANKLSELKTAITIAGLELIEKPDQDGVKRMTATLKTDKDELYATVSPSAIQQIDALADMLDDGETNLSIKVVHRTSNAGRDYIQLELN